MSSKPRANGADLARAADPRALVPLIEATAARMDAGEKVPASEVHALIDRIAVSSGARRLE